MTRSVLAAGSPERGMAALVGSLHTDRLAPGTGSEALVIMGSPRAVLSFLPMPARFSPSTTVLGSFLYSIAPTPLTRAPRASQPRPLAR